MNLEYGSATFTIIWVFGWALFVLLVWYIRGQRKERLIDRIHKERMAALERGLPLPELPDYGGLSGNGIWSNLKLNPRWPLGAGAISVMCGIGGLIAFRTVPDYADLWPLALVLVFFGLGLWLHYFLTRQ